MAAVKNTLCYRKVDSSLRRREQHLPRFHAFTHFWRDVHAPDLSIRVVFAIKECCLCVITHFKRYFITESKIREEEF